MARGKSQGIQSSKLVKPGYKHGRAASERRPAGVSQFGSALGNHATGSNKPIPGAVEDIRGSRKPIGGELGNAVAERTVCGPGGSRKVMKTGTQGQF
jgi:hypothetical protein